MKRTRSENESTYNACRTGLQALKQEVVAHRDMLAAARLVALSIEAIRCVHGILVDEQATVFPSAAYTELLVRREKLREVLSSAGAFPYLEFDPGYSVPEDMAAQAAAAAVVKHGPFKAKGLHKTGEHGALLHLIEKQIYPEFTRLQYSHGSKTGLSKKICELAPLCFETRFEWADLLTAWLWEKKHAEIRTPGSLLNRIAAGERQLRKRQKQRAENLRRNMKRHSRRGPLDERLKLRRDMRKKTIADMAVSDGDLRAGLYAAIRKRLETSIGVRRRSTN